MFWTANFVGPNELNVNNLLKEENLKLTQLLDADDIIQECRSDNKALVEYLTRPEILAELITLITQEPPKDVELTLQYRYANMACEVLTSQMSALSVRILADTALINRLCDFVEQEPPLNPLLASYFSKTIENLLDKSPQQDWCLHRIVCLQAVEALRARRGFLPALLRHLATSAVPDTLRVFIRMKENVVVEWLKEHRFLESLIQIICGTYEPDEPPGSPGLNNHDPQHQPPDTNDSEKKEESMDGSGEEQQRAERAERARRRAGLARLRAVAAANAAALLCDVIRTGCVKDVSDYYRSGTAGWLRGRLAGAADEILRCVFSSPRDRRAQALLGAGDILLELLAAEGQLEAARGGVELALAPHLPLLHQELLREPPRAEHQLLPDYGGPTAIVGAARLQVAALLARLAASAVPEVPSTIMTLGTCGVLLDMFFRFADNTFLHERVLVLVAAAARNAPYADTFLRHFVEECDLLTRLMDRFEDIEKLKGTGKPRPGHAGHVTRLLALLADVLPPAPAALAAPAAPGAPAPPAPPAWLGAPLQQRWAAFVQEQLTPRLTLLDTPLVGYYPADGAYEAEAELPHNTYDLEEPAEGCADLDLDHMMVAMKQFLSGSYYIEDDNGGGTSADLDELFAPAADIDFDADDDKDPWESAAAGAGAAGAAGAPAPVSAEGWASFDDAFGDPFSNANEQASARERTTGQQGAGRGAAGGGGGGGGGSEVQDDFSPFWSYKGCEAGEGGGDANASDLQSALEGLRMGDARAPGGSHDAHDAHVAHNAHDAHDAHDATSEASAASLTSNLLTAISGISPDMLAEYVKACTTLLPHDDLLRGYAQKIAVANESGADSPPRADPIAIQSHSSPSELDSNEIETSEAEAPSHPAEEVTTAVVADMGEGAATAVETAKSEETATGEGATTVEVAAIGEGATTVEVAETDEETATAEGAVTKEMTSTVVGAVLVPTTATAEGAVIEEVAATVAGEGLATTGEGAKQTGER